MGLSINISDFSNTIKKYVGEGILYRSVLKPLNCRFECIQISKGDIICKYSFTETDHIQLIPLIFPTMTTVDGRPQRIEPDDQSKMVGKTFDGKSIEILNNVFMDVDDENAEAISTARFIWVNGISDIPAMAKFPILNLKIKKPLNINIKNFHILINKEADYDVIIKKLERTRGTEITAEMQVYIINPKQADFNETISYLHSTCMDLCYLLSFLSGTFVRWISYDVLSKDGALIKSFHVDAIAKPYHPNEIISNENFGEFITDYFDSYLSKKVEWKLNQIFDQYLDAISEIDFLELRALKVVTLVDSIANRYAKNYNNEFYIDNQIFKKTRNKKRLRRCIKTGLLSSYPEAIKNASIERFSRSNDSLFNRYRQNLKESLEITDSEREYICSIIFGVFWNHILDDLYNIERDVLLNDMCDKSSELNRRKFKAILNDLYRFLNFEITEEELMSEINTFVDIRNALVHRSDFLMNVSGGYDTQPYSQYLFVTSVCRRIILGIIGYRGIYHKSFGNSDFLKYKVNESVKHNIQMRVLLNQTLNPLISGIDIDWINEYLP